jgi:hypothetical protein
MTDIHFDGPNAPWVDLMSPTYGGILNGSADDTAAFNAGVAALLATTFKGGYIFLPANAILNVPGGATLPGAVSMRGSGRNVSCVTASGNDVPTLTLSGQGAVSELTIIGPRAPGNWTPPGTAFGATQPAFQLTSTAANCRVRDVAIVGGFNAVLDQSGDTSFEDLVASNCYGFGIVAAQATARYDRPKLDQPWPIGIPTSLAGLGAVPAWAPGVYAAGAVVTLANPISGLPPYVVQCSVPGATGGTPPALANYGTVIVDGDCGWLLVCRLDYAAFDIRDTGEISISKLDASGSTFDAVRIIDSYSVKMNQCLVGQQLHAGAHTISTKTPNVLSNIQLDGMTLNPGLLSGSAPFIADGGGDTIGIGGDSLLAGGYIGAAVNGVAGFSLNGSAVYGASDAAVVLVNCQRATIVGNRLGSSPEFGANSASVELTGDSDYCIVVGNSVLAQPVNSGSGTHNVIEANG